jgi:hypothetical protein
MKPMQLWKDDTERKSKHLEIAASIRESQGVKRDAAAKMKQLKDKEKDSGKAGSSLKKRKGAPD